MKNRNPSKFNNAKFLGIISDFFYLAPDLRTKESNTESDLVIALKKGDTKAFDTLFANYGKRLYHFANAYLKSMYCLPVQQNGQEISLIGGPKTGQPMTPFQTG